MEINSRTVILPLEEYNNLMEMKKMYEGSDVKALNDQIDKLKQAVNDEKQALKNWADCFHRQMVSENKALVKYLYSHLTSNFNSFGFITFKKLKRLLNDNKEVNKHIEDKETFFDWAANTWE